MRSGDILAERFEIGRLAGAGGMGEVYRARDRMTGASVAVKVLRLKPEEGSDQVERFFREARALSELHHPAIVGYVAHGETASGDVYLAMEWLEGEDLAARLGVARLSIAESVTLARRVSEAMGAAHARGIVHRDLKPENIFLEHGRVERAKVLDFGLARFAENIRQLTRTGITVGTPIYMAPEQALADNHVDARADIFSLGCVLFQCLTGRVPFAGDRVRAVLMKILHEEPPRVSDLRPEVPAPLGDLVSRMLAKDPAMRPSDGNALARELDQFDFGVMASPQSASPSFITRAERRLTCFIVVGSASPPEDDVALAQTLPVDLQVSAARRAIESHGAALDVMADGTLVVTLTTTGSATDLAAQAARCAFSIRHHIRDAPIAVTIGRRETGHASSIGQAVERAVSLLGETSRAPFAPHSPSLRVPIRLDDITAGLLDARFDLEQDEHSAILFGMREFAGKPRTVLGKPTPFVGRDRELATLRASFEECAAEGVARAVLVSAPAGYGKSRLCFEFLRLLTELAVPVGIFRGRANLMSAGAPLAILSSIIRSAALISGAEEIEERRRKIRSRLAMSTTGGEANRLMEFLGELCGTPFPDDSSPALRAARQEPLLMAEQMRRAWEDFLSAECAMQPVVLVLEDLQWGDLPSIKFVDGALRRLRNRPLCVLATARPNIADVFPRLWAERGVTEMRLSALTPRACERIVRAIAPDELSAKEVADIVERAEGNPFYLEEFVRARASGDAARLPGTLIAMVQARIERLDPEARRVLRAASIFGMHFNEADILALLGGRATREDVTRWLGQLSDEELIEAPGEELATAEYGFRQSLVREAAHAMLTEDDRKLGHRLAAQWLATRDGSPLEIAQHYERAERPLDASRWYLKAAETAQNASDLTGALFHCERGIALGAAGKDLGALRAVETNVRLARGEIAAAVAAATEAVALLRRGSARWCRAAATLCTSSFLLGDEDRYRKLLEELLLLEPSRTARNAYDASLANIAMLCSRAGCHEDAGRCLDRILALGGVDRQSDAFTAGRIAHALATDAWFGRAEPWKQLEHARRAVVAFTRCHDDLRIGYSEISVGAALLAMGAHAEAERLLSRRLAIVEPGEFYLCAAAIRPWLGIALAHLGQAARAIEEAQKSIAMSRAARNAYIEGTARAALARIELISGDFEAAEREADDFADGAHQPSLSQAEALASLAATSVRLGKIRQALTTAETVMQWLATRGGMGHAESLARLAHAEALDAMGRRDEARRALSAAQQRLEHRGSNIADPVYRAGFFENVPENVRTLALARKWGV